MTSFEDEQTIRGQIDTLIQSVDSIKDTRYAFFADSRGGIQRLEQLLAVDAQEAKYNDALLTRYRYALEQIRSGSPALIGDDFEESDPRKIAEYALEDKYWIG